MIKDNKMKYYIISIVVFLCGMLSVSLASLFGEYYCVGAAISAIAITILVSSLLNDNTLKENMILLGMCAFTTFFNIIFFLINDIFGVKVYTKGNIGFFGVLVVVTQILAVLFIGYSIVMMTLYVRNKEHIELVDNEENLTNEDETLSSEKEVIETEEENSKQEENVEVKRISNENVKKDVHFMEEE